MNVVGSSGPKVISTLSLASCGGCILSLLAGMEEFLEVFSGFEVGYSHMFTDMQDIPPTDVLLVEGGVRTKENVEMLKKARSRSNMLIAFGTCATHGGVPSLSNLYDVRELLSTVYGEDNDQIPEPMDPVDKYGAIDEHVDVDLYIPGCPPPLNLSLDVIGKLLRSEPVHQKKATVCAECRRKILQKDWLPQTLVHPTRGQPDDDVCLVSQDYFCLGSVTRAGCEAPCPQMGYPCSGCRTLSDSLLRNERPALESVASLMSKRTKLGADIIAKSLHNSALFYHAFTLIQQPARTRNPNNIV